MTNLTRYHCFGLLVFLSLTMAYCSQFSETANKKMDPRSVDTLIPPGQVLVPIEIQNYEALDSVLGQYGVVNIFQAGSFGTGRPIARNVKILRAPLNPSKFAILVPESRSAHIVKSGPLFFVVIQNPKNVGMSFESSATHENTSRSGNKRTIRYGEEEESVR